MTPHRRHLLMLFLLLACTQGVMAQTATETVPPIPEYITFTRAEPVFPAGMVFRVNAEIPEDIDLPLVTLLVGPEGAPAQQFAIPQDDPEVFSRQGVLLEITYVWQFDSVEQMPDLFTMVDYTWTLNLSDGSTDSVTGQVEFVDTRYAWRIDRAIDVPLVMRHVQEGIQANGLFNLLRGPYDLLVENTNPPEPVPVFDLILYPPGATLGCDQEVDGTPVSENEAFSVVIPCNPALTDDYFGQLPETVIQQRGGTLPTTSQIVELMVRRFYAPDWRGADVPLWFQGGVTRVYDSVDNTSAIAEVQRAARGDGLLTLAELQQRPDRDTDEYALWESQSYGLVLYMADEFGLEAAFELASTVEDYESFPVAYEEVTGGSFSALLPSFETWIFTDEALRAYALNLYGVPTPTPTPVRSPTPTNTRLPSATPTATPTITLTPSITPTFSPVPPTATFTPRPAREVFTPTPTVTPVPGLLDIGTNANFTTPQLIALGVIALALVIIIIAAVMMLSRR